MGLDNVWKHNGETASIEGEFYVCGGMLSGHGNSSFRGKVYDSIISEVTEHSLYEDQLSSDIVKEMSEKIQAANFNDIKEFSSYNIRPEEWESFQKMWKAHADAGHELVAWY